MYDKVQQSYKLDTIIIQLDINEPVEMIHKGNISDQL